jgi:transcriptional regulator with XRE-family HTH domain
VTGQNMRHPVSQALRDLRTGLGISQQELASRTKKAIRTIARWEVEQPPHGKALLMLAELAQANKLNEIANIFRQALENELVIGGVAIDPELKPWIAGVHEIFRIREQAPTLWDRLTSTVMDGIRYIDKIKPDARLTKLKATLKKSAMLPAERRLNRLVEEVSSFEGLSPAAAQIRAEEQYPDLLRQCKQERANRESDREYERLHGFLGAEKEP